MPKITVSSDVGNGILPDGEYDFTVDGAILKETRKGDDMIEVKLVIKSQGGVYRVYENLVFTEKAFWKIEQFLKSLGDQLLPGEEIDVEASDLPGRSGRCTITTETYEGNPKNRVGTFLEPDELLK